MSKHVHCTEIKKYRHLKFLIFQINKGSDFFPFKSRVVFVHPIYTDKD